MLENLSQSSLKPTSRLKVALDHQTVEKKRLPSGFDQIDKAFSGGLPFGILAEIGAPPGQRGRELLIPWLRQAMNTPMEEGSPAWVLWAYDVPDLIPYAPAWSARGIPLHRIRFARSNDPLSDLRPVFLEPFFRLIILDVKYKFSPEEYAFIARQARIHDQIIILIKNHFLKTNEGNIWARIRLNTWFDSTNMCHCIDILKGVYTNTIHIKLT